MKAATVFSLVCITLNATATAQSLKANEITQSIAGQWESVRLDTTNCRTNPLKYRFRKFSNDSTLFISSWKAKTGAPYSRGQSFLIPRDQSSFIVITSSPDLERDTDVYRTERMDWQVSMPDKNTVVWHDPNYRHPDVVYRRCIDEKVG